MPKPREYSETGRKKLAHGKETRWCKRCGSYEGVIQQYDRKVGLFNAALS
jgi:small subunit ribosomal protein S14